MSKQEEPQDVIEAYRKSQARSQRAPLIFALAAFFVIAGAAALIFWLTGAGESNFSIASLFATNTPVLSATASATPEPPTPTATNTATPLPATDTPAPTSVPTRSGPVIYVVEEGDSFYSIAEKFEVGLDVLIETNRELLELDPANPIIKVGDEILIPPPGAELPTPTALPADLPAGTTIDYRVQSGDTLEGIALKFNSTLDDIIKRNEELADDPNNIFVGQLLVIRVNLVTAIPTDVPVEETATPTP
ncbi:MAG: LysM peptidoglycan-binding domain-containing protein [Chloroflexi bacterium]|nr:LysM peptidoglycan-binding domain-containing protein [Chloroflexota bacterium]